MSLLTVGLIAIFSLAYLLAKGDIFRPSVLVAMMIMAAAICNEYLAVVWEYNISLYTTVIILSAILLIVLFDYFSTLIISPKSKRIIKITTIIPSKIGYVFCAFLSTLAIILHYSYLIQAVGFQGSFALMVSTFRDSVVLEELEVGMSSLLSNCMNFSFYAGFVFLYVFINNVIASGSVRKNFYILYPTIAFCIESLFTGARGYIMYYVFAAIIYIYVLQQRKIGWKTKMSNIFLRKLIIIMVFVAILFALSATLLGRDSGDSMFIVISRYLAGGIALLNDYFDKGATHSEVFGGATFSQLYSYIYSRIGKINPALDYQQFEFRTYNGNNWGNVYTPLRRYYQDFGLIGVVIFPILFAIFFGFLYTYIKRKTPKNDIDFSLVFYGILIRSQFLYFFDDELFSDFFTPACIKNVIILYIVIFLISGKISILGRRIHLKINLRHNVYRSNYVN